MSGYFSGKGFAPILTATAAALALSSCTVPADITLSSVAEPVSAQGAVSMAEEAESDGTRATFAAALRKTLQDSSVAVADNAPLILEYSLSKRDAETGIADPLQPGATDVTWQSDERTSKLFDGCDVTRFRAGLLLVDRASGTVAYRGTGDMDTCSVTDGQVRQLARALVSDAQTKGALHGN